MQKAKNASFSQPTLGPRLLRSVQGLVDLFGATAVGQRKGESGGSGPFVGVHYSCALAGEATSRPHLRIPTFREAHCMRLIKAAVAAAGNDDEFPPGHLFVMCDGNVHILNFLNATQLANTGVKMVVKKKEIF